MYGKKLVRTAATKTTMAKTTKLPRTSATMQRTATLAKQPMLSKQKMPARTLQQAIMAKGYSKAAGPKTLNKVVGMSASNKKMVPAQKRFLKRK